MIGISVLKVSERLRFNIICRAEHFYTWTESASEGARQLLHRMHDAGQCNSEPIAGTLRYHSPILLPFGNLHPYTDTHNGTFKSSIIDRATETCAQRMGIAGLGALLEGKLNNASTLNPLSDGR